MGNPSWRARVLDCCGARVANCAILFILSIFDMLYFDKLSVCFLTMTVMNSSQ